MLAVQHYHPLSNLLGKKLISSIEHLANPEMTHNRDLDAACLVEWLARYEPALYEYRAKCPDADFVEPLENCVRLAKAALALA